LSEITQVTHEQSGTLRAREKRGPHGGKQAGKCVVGQFQFASKGRGLTASGKNDVCIRASL